MAVMKWFRLYHEARTDAKLESLPDDQFRVWHRLLCFASEQPTRGVIAGFTARLLAVEVARGDVALLERTLQSLRELRIIDGEDGSHHFAQWEKRQYRSDNVTERVVKHRERAKRESETLQKRFRNVGETAPDTDTERDPDHSGESDRKGETASGAEAPADDAEFSRLCREITQAAGITLKKQAIRDLIEQHPKLDARQIVYQVRLAAEWIADPDRNRGTKSKPPRKMGTLFLHNWLNRAQEPPPAMIVQMGPALARPARDEPDPHYRYEKHLPANKLPEAI